MKRNILAYLNHAAMNLGNALASLWHGIVPPQWTRHTESKITSLAHTTPWRAFVDGLIGNGKANGSHS